MYKALSVKLFYFTADHPQTNSFNKCTKYLTLLAICFIDLELFKLKLYMLKMTKNNYKLFKIKHLLNKCVTRRRCQMIVQYLVWWKKCGLEFDYWYSKSDLNNAIKLIENYKCNIKRPCHCHCSMKPLRSLFVEGEIVTRKT